MRNSRTRAATHVRRLVLGAAAICALAAAPLATSAQAAPPYYTATPGGTLHVRTMPRVEAQSVADLNDNTVIDIYCQSRGSRVGQSQSAAFPAGSTMWDYITSPVSGWVSDWYTNTPGVNQATAGLPYCYNGTDPFAVSDDPFAVIGDPFASPDPHGTAVPFPGVTM